jgi:hypothetical protein
MPIATTLTLLWLMIGMGLCAYTLPTVREVAPQFPELVENLHKVASRLRVTPDTLFWWIAILATLVGWPAILWVWLNRPR